MADIRDITLDQIVTVTEPADGGRGGGALLNSSTSS